VPSKVSVVGAQPIASVPPLEPATLALPADALAPARPPALGTLEPALPPAPTVAPAAPAATTAPPVAAPELAFSPAVPAPALLAPPLVELPADPGRPPAGAVPEPARAPATSDPSLLLQAKTTARTTQDVVASLGDHVHSLEDMAGSLPLRRDTSLARFSVAAEKFEADGSSARLLAVDPDEFRREAEMTRFRRATWMSVEPRHLVVASSAVRHSPLQRSAMVSPDGHGQATLGI